MLYLSAVMSRLIDRDKQKFSAHRSLFSLHDHLRGVITRGHMYRLKRAVAALVIGLAVAAGAGSSANAVQPIARAACSRDIPAIIGGKHKCLGPGEYCALRYERQYEHYGFECSTRYNPPRLKRRG